MENSKKPSTSSTLFFRVEQILREAGVCGKHACLALSGGIDSVALLHILANLSGPLGFSLVVKHVNHNLSPHAKTWADFCGGLCKEYGLPFEVRNIVVSKTCSKGLEASARKGRFEALLDTPADFLFLAHHRGDQAETLLHRLLRGSGVKGAVSIRAKQAWLNDLGQSVVLLRPLLDVARADIEAFAEEHRLVWVSDESNSDLGFARNFFRHEVLPRIYSRFPGGEAALARAASHFAEADELLSDLAAIDFRAALIDEALDVEVLRALGENRSTNLIRGVLIRLGLLTPSSEMLREKLRQVFSVSGGGDLGGLVSGLQLAVFDRKLFFLRPPGDVHSSLLECSVTETLRWRGGRLLFEPVSGAGLCLDRLGGSRLLVATRRGGERLALSAGAGRKSLKKLFQERRIPPWVRDSAPCIWFRDQLVGVGGLGISHEYACRPEDAGVLVKWIPFDRRYVISGLFTATG